MRQKARTNMDGGVVRGRRVLSLRALNRATLARQLLLTRRPIRPVDAIARLAGLQAEDAESPCIALWSRIDRFDFEQLERALQERRVVRASLMRGTLHIVSAADYLCWRQALQSVLVGAFRGFFPRDAKSADLGRVLEEAQHSSSRSLGPERNSPSCWRR